MAEGPVPYRLLPANPIGISVTEISLAGVELPRTTIESVLLCLLSKRTLELAEGDDPSRAAVDTERAASAFILVDNKEPPIGDVLGGVINVDRLGDGVEGQIENAFPRTDIDAAFTQYAFGLVNVKKLLGSELVLEVIGRDQSELIVVAERRILINNPARHLLASFHQWTPIR
jgi:hypothetical protein